MGPSYGAVYFEPVAEAALILGIDLGARFLRGALSDLDGHRSEHVRTSSTGASTPDAALEAIVSCATQLVRSGRPRRRAGRRDVVVGVPGVVEAGGGAVGLATNVPGLDGSRYAADLEERLGVASHARERRESRRRSASGVSASLEESTTSCSSPSARASVPVSCCAASCNAAITAQPASSTTLRSASSRRSTRAPLHFRTLALGAIAGGAAPTQLASPYDARPIFAAARRGDALGTRASCEKRRGGSLCTSHRSRRYRCRARRPGRWHRCERRAARRRAAAARCLAAVSAAGRDLEPRRRRRADGRGLGRARVRARAVFFRQAAARFRDELVGAARELVIPVGDPAGGMRRPAERYLPVGDRDVRMVSRLLGAARRRGRRTRPRPETREAQRSSRARRANQSTATSFIVIRQIQSRRSGR